MGKTLVTINESGHIQNFVFPNTTSQDVVNLLLAEPANERTVVANFLTYIGASVSVDTPDSSNVRRIEFNFASSEINFVFDNDSVSSYPSTFEKFLEDITAPSAGKQQWKYRRGER